MHRLLLMTMAAIVPLVLTACGDTLRPPQGRDRAAQTPNYAGSTSCRECHERFYQLWSTSFHGLAMLPYGAEVTAKLSPQAQPIFIGQAGYQADIETGVVVERSPSGEKRYPIRYAMGGKYVYYFLTPLEKGRLQTLPVSYDLRRKEWFDTALSGVRHFPDRRATEPAGWKAVSYTFNTACRDCHVSQRASTYDAETDTFHTVWKEPGINCETCHGPSDEHNRIMRKLPKGEKPEDFRIIRTKTFTPSQHNDSCNSCHAKLAHLTEGYRPTERFFDHFDLVTLEDPDFYPDGRDLGENYTMTSWMMNRCATKSNLHCVVCHTSSGRYRFRKPEDADKACLPCHEKRVEDVAAHSHHPAGSVGSRCVSCHMPKTEFARITRSDHSFRPPTPATTLRFGSPNACNICHKDRNAEWADRQVRIWFPRDYQAPVLNRAGLVEAARKHDWKRLPEMLDYIASQDRDTVFAASLIRLLDVAEDPGKIPVLLSALKDPSPLVRAAAADTLGKSPGPWVLSGLLPLTGDEYRLVRIAAAGVLANYPENLLHGADAVQLGKAIDEFLVALRARPLSWVAHYNLGNYYLSRNLAKDALEEYDAALRLEPKATVALVNSATAYAREGNPDKAEECLKKAVAADPRIAVAHYNLGLLAAGRGDFSTAEEHLIHALQVDPSMADAAANLCFMIFPQRPAEAISWCAKAAETVPQEPRYAYSLALYQRKAGDPEGAVETVKSLITRVPAYAEAYLLMGDILEEAGKTGEAEKAYERLLAMDGISADSIRAARQRLDAIRK